jgi:phosphoglycerate dehydrogenase-like enzyme
VLSDAELTVLRPGALIVNVVHPELIDPDALLVAITSRNIRAAVDTECSGSAWDRLVALGPHRFLTVPQMGYSTSDANHRTASYAAKAVCDVLDGMPSNAVHNTDYLAVRRNSRGEGYRM